MTDQPGGALVDSGAGEAYRFGAFTLSVKGRRLSRAGEPVTLPSRVFDLLVHLVRHHDQIVDKDALIRVGWADAFVTDDSLIHGISVLRRALGDDSASPRFIVTLPRRGYQFMGPVERLDESGSPAAPEQQVASVDARRGAVHRPWLWGAVALTAAAVTVGTIWGNQDRGRLPQVTGPIRLAQLPPPGSTLVSGGVLSRDGRQMAFVARDRASGQDSLWIQSLGASEPQALPGTEGASQPFWSPASDALGYFLGNTLQVVALAGDPPRAIASGIVVPSGGAWGEGDVILYADGAQGIFAVNAAGAPPIRLTTVDPGSEVAHLWPQFLPEGTRFLYSVTSMDSSRVGTWVGSLDRGERPSQLLQGRVGGVYSPPDHILYVRHGTLYAEQFDPSTLEISGSPLLVARNVPEPRLPLADRVSASGGVLTFKSASRPHQLTWFDRSGRRTGTVSTPTSFHNPALAPDERVLAVTGLPSETPGLWLIDLDRSASTLLEADGVGPAISPDSSQVAFTSRGGLEIRVRNLVGQATERVLFTDERRKVVQDWSPDGRYLIFSTMQPSTGLDFWMLPLAEASSPVPLLATAANERQARISPDGRWLAYTSDESGSLEVYVQELPGLGSKRALSIGGGAGPAWAGNGRELFYLSPDKRLMSVEFGASGPRSPNRPVPLFSPPLSGNVWDARNYYVVSRNGERFLFNAVEEQENIPITVMVNWLSTTRAE